MESCSPGLLPFRWEYGCTHLQMLLLLQERAPRRAIYTFQLSSELTLALRPGDTPSKETCPHPDRWTPLAPFRKALGGAIQETWSWGYSSPCENSPSAITFTGSDLVFINEAGLSLELLEGWGFPILVLVS